MQLLKAQKKWGRQRPDGLAAKPLQIGVDENAKSNVKRMGQINT
jgi:hypothetical protein